MTTSRRGTAIIEFPSALEIVITRHFDAPMALVFDCFTKVEHVRQTIAPFGEDVTECSIDLRAGGNYHFVFVTNDGVECSFRGTYLEVDAPRLTVATWLFEGWPDAEAVETVLLKEANDVTTLTWTLAFRDQAGRNHMTKFDGIESNLDIIDDHLRTLLNPEDSA